MLGPAQAVPPPHPRAVRPAVIGSGLCGGPAPPCLLGVHSLSGGLWGAGGLGTKYRFGRTAEAVTAAGPSGCIHIGVAGALAQLLIASIDVAVARYLPARISSSSLRATSYGLAPSCRILTGPTGRFQSRHTSSLSLVLLPRSSRAGSRPLTPCNVLAEARRKVSSGFVQNALHSHHAQDVFPAFSYRSRGSTAASWPGRTPRSP